MSRLSPKLNRKLMLEHRSQTPDNAGGFQTLWMPLGELWAEVATRSGRDRSGNAGPISATAYRITVRAAPQGAESRPQPGQRFRDGGRAFRIEAVAERDLDARFLVCFAEEEVAA